MDLLPQPTEDDEALIFDSFFRFKIRIDNPGEPVQESIMLLCKSSWKH